MSVVEKAAEKLKTLQSDPSVLPRTETATPRTASTVERSQERMRTTAEVAQTASPWHVDEKALKRMGFHASDDEAGRRLTDELRRVKRPLLDNVTGKSAKALAHGQRIVVTSAVPGEGKTFTAVNLALSLAREPDFEVLLVDGDIPKSDITRVLGLEGHPGLMEVLADERRQPAEIIVPTDVPNLLVVPAGERHPLSAELFGGQRMEYVLGELGDRNRRRLVIFDSPPLLATSESQVLVSHMGQVVMVIAAGRTRQQEVRLAMQSFDDSQYVGLILNMSRLPASENHYYSRYGYYYSNGR